MDGLYSVNNFNVEPSTKKVKEFENTPVWSLASSNPNDTWIGTYGKGLFQFNSPNKITKWDFKSPKSNSLSLDYNKSLLQDSKKNTWVGFWGVGIARINNNSKSFDIWLNEPENKQSLSQNDVWVIKEDKFGRIWIGTQGGGLNLFEDRKGGIFHNWLGAENI